MNLNGGRDAPQLLDEAARALYLAILERGGRIEASEVPDEGCEALQRLVSLGLLVNPILDSAFTAVNPRAVAGRLGAWLRAEGARLLAQAEEASARLDELAQAYASTSPGARRAGTIQHIRDKAQIQHRIAQLEHDSVSGVVVMQPGGARPPRALVDAARKMRAYLARGCELQVLYQSGAREDAATAAYAADITEAGAKVRVLHDPFELMMIFDRRIAVIPASDDHSVAAIVEDPAVVELLLDGFERDWERAERVQWDAAPPDRLTPLGRLLAQGLTQRTIATRLGLSERTVAAQIARLRELYDAETLFQLGWQMRALDGDGKGEPSR